MGGGPWCFDELWQLRGRVRVFLCNLGAGWNVIDDLCAETYMVVWSRREEVPSDEEAAVSWICGVARNVLRNHRRSERRRRERGEAWVTAFAEDKDPHSASEPTVIARVSAQDAWDTLSEEDRRILSWAAEGVPLDDLAELLECRRSAAAMRLSRARKRLARDL